MCCFFSASTSEHGRPGQAALEGDHVTCLTLLLRRGADLETKNHNQQTLLQCITKKYGQTRTDKLLKESGNKWGVKERTSGPVHAIDPFHKWLLIINSFVSIKISLTNFAFELIIQKNFYPQMGLVRLI